MVGLAVMGILAGVGTILMVPACIVYAIACLRSESKSRKAADAYREKLLAGAEESYRRVERIRKGDRL